MHAAENGNALAKQTMIDYYPPAIMKPAVILAVIGVSCSTKPNIVANTDEQPKPISADPSHRAHS